MADWRRTIENIVSASSKIFWQMRLTEYTTLRIGGLAECFIIVNSYQDLIEIIKFANREKIRLSVIGQGSNLLITNQTINGTLIKLGKGFDKIQTIGSCSTLDAARSTHHAVRLAVGCATSLSKLLNYATKNNLSGIEFVWGIPGSLGGAIYCNAGAFGHSIGDVIEQVNGYLPDGESVNLFRKDLKFSYRKSHLPCGLVITDAVISLTHKPASAIKSRINQFRTYRLQSQPSGASAGSVFKNPTGVSAGTLIDDCGLKGLRIGDAVISEKHANFIINKQNARFNDVYELLQIIKSVVENKTAIILEPEIEIFPKK